MKRGARLIRFHPVPEALIGNDEMLGQRRRLLGLVDAQFDLIVAARSVVDGRDVLRDPQRLIQGTAILDGARRQASSSR